MLRGKGTQDAACPLTCFTVITYVICVAWGSRLAQKISQARLADSRKNFVVNWIAFLRCGGKLGERVATLNSKPQDPEPRLGISSGGTSLDGAATASRLHQVETSPETLSVNRLWVRCAVRDFPEGSCTGPAERCVATAKTRL